MQNFYKRILTLSIGVALAGISGSASAAFFQLAENNASGIGNAFAGGAAIADDASTIWTNPAGMTRLVGSQVVVAGHVIMPSTEFHKTSATRVNGSQIPGGEGGNAGESAIVPNAYYSLQLNDKLWFGLGMNAPYGLATDYEDTWVGRYHADRSELMTVNINPSLAYKVGDQFSIGGGLNVQRIDAQLTQAVDVLLLGAGACGTADGYAKVKADDTSLGFNLGAMWSLMNDTRFGFAYRSKIKHKLKGDFDIDGPAGCAGLIGRGIVDSGAEASVTMPETYSLSAFHKLTPQWEIMGDITRTRWSRLPELRIDFDSSQADSVVTLGLKDVNRYSIGATYMPSSNWSYRFGIALDKTPVPSEDVRTPRLPDADRLWVALGAGYRFSQSAKIDFGFVHIKVDDANVNKVATLANENVSRGNLVGSYEASVNIVSVQGNWSF